MDPEPLYRRYQELQHYVGWTDDDARRVQAVAGLLDPYLAAMIDDFYEEIDRHPDARKVITGGAAQVQRLKGTLLGWLRDLLSGPYDMAYVARRSRVGWRHVEIGLDQVYTNVALSRLRTGLTHALHEHWPGDPPALRATVRSLNRLLDLDLAIIEDAYQPAPLPRQGVRSGGARRLHPPRQHSSRHRLLAHAAAGPGGPRPGAHRLQQPHPQRPRRHAGGAGSCRSTAAWWTTPATGWRWT